MKKIISLFIIIAILLSCSINKEVKKVTSSQNNECLAKLDSLSNLLKHIKFGVYSVDLAAFSIQKYKGLSDLELAVKGVSLDEYGQRVHEFDKFVKAFSKDKNCLAITSEILSNKIGKSYSTSLNHRDTNKVTYRYLFNIGIKCPNCNEPINRIFDGCSYLSFYFEYKELKSISFALY